MKALIVLFSLALLFACGGQKQQEETQTAPEETMEMADTTMVDTSAVADTTMME